MRFLKKSVLVIGLCALVALGVGVVPTVAGAEGKIGVVNMDRLLQECKQGKRATAELKRKFQEYDKKIKSLRQDIQTAQRDLENTAMLLKPEARMAKEREYERKVRRLRDLDRDAQQSLSQARADNLNPILRNAMKIIRQIGATGKYSLILQAKGQLYYPTSSDITSQVIAAYDKAHP